MSETLRITKQFLILKNSKMPRQGTLLNSEEYIWNNLIYVKFENMLNYTIRCLRMHTQEKNYRIKQMKFPSDGKETRLLTKETKRDSAVWTRFCLDSRYTIILNVKF